MTEIPTIRVREINGMRRFLYPLTAEAPIPAEIDTARIALTTASGAAVPVHVRRLKEGDELCSIDFAVSLSPYEIVELTASEGSPEATPDAMQIATPGRSGLLSSKQERLSIDFDGEGALASVVYDGVSHLRGPAGIMRNGEPLIVSSHGMESSGLRGALTQTGAYSDGRTGQVSAEITACKSWITLRTAYQATSGNRTTFTLPFSVTSTNLLCDFGAGGGVYTRLSRKDTAEVRWRIDDRLNWTLTNGTRVDYRGVLSRSDQRHQPDYHGIDAAWFHVVDGNKAIAVAITEAPRDISGIDVAIRSNGDIVVDFTASPLRRGEVNYGVCYHFLNDIPAIAAATCPQSIMLRPVVEVD